MPSVTISPKFQVVIPKSIREPLGLSPGQKLEAVAHSGRIELIPIRPIREMKGFLEGIETTIEREEGRT